MTNFIRPQKRCPALGDFPVTPRRSWRPQEIKKKAAQAAGCFIAVLWYSCITLSLLALSRSFVILFSEAQLDIYRHPSHTLPMSRKFSVNTNGTDHILFLSGSSLSLSLSKFIKACDWAAPQMGFCDKRKLISPSWTQEYYVKEEKKIVQNPINGNLSEPNNAAPFMSSSAARRLHSGRPSLSVGQALKSTQISFWIHRRPSEWNICSFKICRRPARCFRIVLHAACRRFYLAVYKWRDTETPAKKLINNNQQKKKVFTRALPGCQPQLPGSSWVKSRRRACVVQI